jgi:uncharacterized protein YggE
MIYREGENIPGSYRVTNRLNVSVKNIDLVGKLIDAAIKAGANEMTSLEFSSSDTAEAAKQARGLAITQAKESAQLLAETAGSRLGPVLSITELQDSMPVPRPLMKTAAFGAAEAVADSTPVSANSSTVVITVEARFALY